MTQDTSTVPQTRESPLEFKIETILVPLDFSPASLGALDYAVWLAKQFRAAIHLVHVYPPDEASSVPGAAHLLLQSAEAIERLNEELTGIHRKHVPTFCPENCHIRGGRSYEEIVRVAREIGADLIVLSTRGHSGLKHLLLGSTAERVVRNALPCACRTETETNIESNCEAFAIRTILVPTDFSQCSLAGTEYAAFLAKKLNATLRLFHAMYPYTNYVFVDRAGVRLSGLAEAVEEPPGKKWTRSSRWIFYAAYPFKPNFSLVSRWTKSAPQPANQMLISSSLPLTAAQV